MRTIPFLFFIAGCLLADISVNAEELDGPKINFNAGWKFQKGDIPGGQQSAYDDSSWEEINLPHDWSIKEKFSPQWASGTGYLPGGIGWYRKTFVLPDTVHSGKVSVYFDGIYKNSEVWINGHYLGKRPNGFIPFQYELTEFLNPGGAENVIAVRVDHSDFADSRWYTGSGINRNVYLLTTDSLHIDLWGVKFTTDLITGQSAKAMIAVSVINGKSSGEEVRLEAKLVDREGNIAGRSGKNISLNKGEKMRNDLSLTIKDPVLWSVDNPYLYRLEVLLVDQGEIIDQQTIPVGIRSFRFDAGKGFFLNGKNMKIKGVCIHDDAGVLGTAVPEEVWAHRLKTLKEAGCNAIRMSHNPHAGYLYDLCDEMGFLVQDEAFDEWELGKNKWIQGRNVGNPGKDGYNKYFQEWAEKDVKDMVRRNQDHPSIIMWSIGNEIDYPNDPYTHKVLDEGRNPQIFGRGYDPARPHVKELEPVAANLVKWVREEDNSRPVTAALAGVAMSNYTRYPEYLDIAGYNYQEYLYEEDRLKYPQRVIYGSENGMSLEAWKAVKDHDYICGQFLWTGTDYLGEAGRWPDNHSRSGLLDLAGNPKPEYYFRKSLWTDDPMIYIGTSERFDDNKMNIWAHKKAGPNWNWEKGDTVRVNCFTNCEAGELFLNGQSLGRKKLSGSPEHVLHWDIPFRKGSLVAKGYNKGKEVACCELKTSGKAASVQAEFYRSPSGGETTTLHQLMIRIIDEAGNIVPDADNTVQVEVAGNGELLGLENGDEDGQVDYLSHARKVNKGKLLAYIHSFPGKGEMIIHLASPGLDPQTLRINTK